MCSSTRGPAISPLLVTWPMSNTALWEGVGVPGSESIHRRRRISRQANEAHLWDVGVPGSESIQGWNEHFQAGQRGAPAGGFRQFDEAHGTFPYLTHVGVPGNEWPSIYGTHFQAGQRCTLRSEKEGVGVPGNEGFSARTTHFQAGQRRTCKDTMGGWCAGM